MNYTEISNNNHGLTGVGSHPAAPSRGSSVRKLLSKRGARVTLGVLTVLLLGLGCVYKLGGVRPELMLTGSGGAGSAMHMMPHAMNRMDAAVSGMTHSRVVPPYAVYGAPHHGGNGEPHGRAQVPIAHLQQQQQMPAYLNAPNPGFVQYPVHARMNMPQGHPVSAHNVMMPRSHPAM